MGNPRIDLSTAPTPSLNSSGESSSDSSGPVDDAFAVYSFLSHEIQAKLGKDFLGKMPLEHMERYCLATVENGHPTADMLHQLVVNFLQAYSNPETNAEALKAFDYLEFQAEQASK